MFQTALLGLKNSAEICIGFGTQLSEPGTSCQIRLLWPSHHIFYLDNVEFGQKVAVSK